MGRIDDIIDAILVREGGFVDHPADEGGKTKFGITIRDHPDLWADGDVTPDEARGRYFQQYVYKPGFHQIADPVLQAQVIDYGVNSGPVLVIQILQRILGVDVDGKLGPGTLDALAKADPRTINNRLVGERIKMFGRLVSKKPTQSVFLNGWLNRALEFLV